MDEIQKRLLLEVADLHEVPEGAYNIRANSQSAGRRSTANIEITSKQDVSGLEIRIKPGTKNESVHIPVVMTESGLKEVVYNDFFIGEGADVVIVAGCGIDNCGNQDSQHDGIHRFFLDPGAKVRYVEKHYGSGDGKGKRILNPVTEVYMKENSTMDHRGGTGRRGKAGGAGAADDPWGSAGDQHLRCETERKGFQRGCGQPVCGKGQILPEVRR